MKRGAVFYLLLANALGGAAYPLAAVALRGFSPIELVFCRTLISLVLFAPFLYKAARERGWLRDWPRIVAVGLFGYATPILLGTIGQNLSSATNAALLIGVEPVCIVLLSAALLGEEVSSKRSVAIALGLTGATVVAVQGIPLVQASLPSRGDLILAAHGFFWSLYTIIGKPVLKRVDAMTFTALTTAIALVPIAVLTGGRVWPATPPGAASILAVVALGVFISFLCTWAFNRALELAPAQTMANFILLQPLIGSGLGVGFLGDRFTAWTAVGGAMIVFGAWLAAHETEGTGPEAVLDVSPTP